MKKKAAIIAIIIAILMVLLIIIPRDALSLTRYGEMICQNEGYTCLKVQKGQSWESLFPDENQRAIVMRINRINVPLHRVSTIAVPDNLSSVDYMQQAPFDQRIEATGNKIIIIDPALLAFGAYNENGDLVRWGPVAAGKNWCPDIGSSCRTKTGVFKVYEKRGQGCFSSKFPLPNGGAPMPYCMFFKGGYAIHASTDVPGYHASHGCVRVFYEDAQWLNQQFAEVGTTVVVKSYEA